FYERSEPWWHAYQREPELIDAWASGEARYYEAQIALIATALGDLASDRGSMAVLSAVVGPPTIFAFRSSGLSYSEAGTLAAELAVPWLERRARELSAASWPPAASG